MSCVFYHVFTVFFLIAFSFCSVFASIFHPYLLYSVTVWVYLTVTIFILVISLYLIFILF